MVPFIALTGGFVVLRLIGVAGIDALDSWQPALRGALALMFVFTGVPHFLPSWRRDFVAMIPPSFPRPALLVTLTGVLELAGAVGLLIAPVAPYAAIGLALLMIAMFPANLSADRRAPYVTPKESELLLKGSGIKELEDVPPEALSRTRTNAFTGAEPSGRRRSLPLVVLSPGFTWPRSSLTGLAEDLASRGYVVAGIDHTYENFATTFPDGRIAPCAACANVNDDDFGEKVIRSRAIDIPFVLDQLTGPRPKWKGGALIDPARIAMAGQSIGGAAAPETMVKDSRVRAGINMDGSLFLPIPRSGLARPFMLMGAPSDDSTWKRDWAHLTGWKRWLVVKGAVHPSFTDYDMLLQQLGVDLGGGLKGTRSMDITREYVAAFFGLHLRGKAQPLLDKPSRRYPEVRFCAPSVKNC